jgi:hypothetical protein
LPSREPLRISRITSPAERTGSMVRIKAPFS